MPKIPQKERILEALRKADGAFVSGRYFGQTMMISQFHSRIWELQDEGYDIIASETTDQYGFKSYKLAEGQLKLV